MRLIELRPPRVALALALLAGIVQVLLPTGWGRVASAPAAGTLVALSGLSILLRGWWLFRRQGVEICPTSDTARLITGDVYRFTRNPMYLGLVLLLAAPGLALGSLPFGVAALACFGILNAVFCPYEEAKLLQTFGATYQDYLQRVRRWL